MAFPSPHRAVAKKVHLPNSRLCLTALSRAWSHALCRGQAKATRVLWLLFRTSGLAGTMEPSTPQPLVPALP